MPARGCIAAAHDLRLTFGLDSLVGLGPFPWSAPAAALPGADRRPPSRRAVGNEGDIDGGDDYDDDGSDRKRSAADARTHNNQPRGGAKVSARSPPYHDSRRPRRGVEEEDDDNNQPGGGAQVSARSSPYPDSRRPRRGVRGGGRRRPRRCVPMTRSRRGRMTPLRRPSLSSYIRQAGAARERGWGRRRMLMTKNRRRRRRPPIK